MAGELPKRDWLERVLGISLGESTEPSPVKLLPIWRDAKEAVDAQLSQLEQALRQTGSGLGAAIADRGLVGMLGKDYIGLTAALIDLDSGASAARGRLLTHSAGIRQALSGVRGIALIESNPLGIAVTPRAILGAALDKIERHARS